MFIKDSTFTLLCQKKKIKGLFNIRTIEVTISLIVSLIITIILFNLLKAVNIKDINELIRSLSKDLAVAMIGLIGFVISGLAILTSAVSNRVMNIIKSRSNKIDKLITIFVSFYFEGILIGILIVILLLVFCASYSAKPINLQVALV